MPKAMGPYLPSKYVTNLEKKNKVNSIMEVQERVDIAIFCHKCLFTLMLNNLALIFYSIETTFRK
jgi:hypothetical protein